MNDIVALLAPDFYKAMQQSRERQEKAVYANLCAREKPQPWDEQKTKFERILFLDAKSWKPSVFFDAKTINGAPNTRLTGKNEKKLIRCPTAPFLYCLHALPAGEPLSICQGRRTGQCYFSKRVAIPVLCEITEYNPIPRVWMSLTPMEIFTQRSGIRLAQGRVVVGGLGLGWFLNAVCCKKSVTDVTVVEKSEPLLNWLWPEILKAYPAVQRARKVVGDIYDFMEADQAHHADTRYLLDIWKSYGGLDRKFEEWRKRLPRNNLWGWGMFGD